MLFSLLEVYFFCSQAWFASLGRREVNEKFPQGHILSPPHLCLLKYDILSESLLGRYRKYFESVLLVDNNCCRFFDVFLVTNDDDDDVSGPIFRLS